MYVLFRSVGKANEALTRIGMGLAANPSVTESEMLLYVHATVAPFLLPQVLNLGPSLVSDPSKQLCRDHHQSPPSESSKRLY